MRERRVLWVVLAAFVVGLVAVAGLAAVDDDAGSGPPRLPALALGGAGRDAGAAMAADSSMMPAGRVDYRVAGSLPELADHARAWEVGSVSMDDVRDLASRMGLDGDVKDDAGGWVVTDGDRQLRVERVAGGPWSFARGLVDCGPDTAVSSDGAVSGRGCGFAASGTATAPAATSPPATVEPCPMPDCPPGTACTQMCPTPAPMPMPEPERPADLPSMADAERIGRAFLTKAGLDLDDADVRVDDGFNQWMVNADPRVADLPTQGFTWSVAVGPKGEIGFANGSLADPRRGNDYPLAGVQAGIERLKSGYGAGGWSAYPPGGPEPAIASDMPACTDCPPQVRTITGVRLGLQFSPVYSSDDGPPTRALLVPSYFFRFDDTDLEQPVLAVADEFLPKPPEVKPMPAEPGDGIGNGASCQGEGSTAADGNAPLTIDVCVDPNPAKAGQPVTFDVTYADPDAPIVDDGCTVPEPDFEHGMTSVCAPSCAAPADGTPTTVAPAEPGKLAKRYTHTYEKPGTYQVTFAARSGHDCDTNPHASQGQVTVAVTVE